MQHVGRISAIAVVAVVLVVGGVLVACDGDERGPDQVLEDFLDGWRAGDLDGVPLVDPQGSPRTGADVLAEIDLLAGDLDARRVNATAMPSRVVDGSADATVRIEWGVVQDVVWPYQTTVRLRELDDAWRVVFEPAVVHPRLTVGQHLAGQRLDAARGSILGGDDGPIFGPLAPTNGFAQGLLGTVGEVTPVQLAAEPGRYLPGERVGQSGLQQLYDDVLRGRPGVVIWIAGAPDPLFQADPKAGAALRTTIDARLQAAADAALVGQGGACALVAVRVSDGAIVAVANGPEGTGENLAFTASTTPGPAFTPLTALGADVGFGTTWHLGVPVDTSASPVALAVATATIARGSWRTPRLFPSLPPGAPAPEPGPAGDPPEDGAAPLGTAVASLRDTLVAGDAGLPATARARVGLSGSDSWVTGWQGDVAFTVLVRNGDGAVDVVEAFLRRLA